MTVFAETYSQARRIYVDGQHLRSPGAFLRNLGLAEFDPPYIRIAHHGATSIRASTTLAIRADVSSRCARV